MFSDINFKKSLAGDSPLVSVLLRKYQTKIYDTEFSSIYFTGKFFSRTSLRNSEVI